MRFRKSRVSAVAGPSASARLGRWLLAAAFLFGMAMPAQAQLDNLLRQLGNIPGVPALNPPAAPYAPRPSYYPPPAAYPPPAPYLGYSAARPMAPQRLRAPPSPPASSRLDAAASPMSEGPSFRCDRAGPGAEKRICQSADLSGLDRAIAGAYSAARQAAGPDGVERLQAEQVEWLRRRNACGLQDRCLGEAMQTRLAQLSTIAAAAPAQPPLDGPSWFDASPISRLALLKLLMASRPDLFRNDVVPLLYRALLDRWRSPDCDRAMAAIGNELRLGAYVTESRAWMDQRIAEAQGASVARLRIDGSVILGAYDEAAGAFVVPPQHSQASILDADAIVPNGLTQPTDLERNACPIGTPSSLGRQAAEVNAATTMNPVLHVHGGQAITTLPMARPVAMAWLDRLRTGSREVRIETVVEVSRQPGALVGRVVMARAVDVNTGAVLHVYDPGLFGAGPQQAAAGATAAQVTAPAAEFGTLFAMLVASRPEQAADDDVVLFWQALQFTWNTPTCNDFWHASQNELRRRDLVAQIRPGMIGALADVRQAGGVRMMTVSMRAQLGDYDKGRQSFTLLEPTTTPLLRQVTITPRPDWCHVIYADSLPRTGLLMSIDDGGVLTGMPMDPDAAAARLDMPPAGEPRAVRIDVVVAVRATSQGLSAQLVSAKAVDPRDGGVLHVYAPAGAAPPTGVPVPAATAATRAVLAFEALHLDPRVLDDAGLLRMTKQQIELDQYAYQTAARSGGLDVSSQGHVFAFGLNDVRDKNPDFAASELAPRLRGLLNQLANGAPAALYAGRAIGGPAGDMPAYDHATSTMRLRCCYLRAGLPAGSFELLSPPAYFERGANLATKPVAPASASEIDRRAIYELRLAKEPAPAPALDARAAGLAQMPWQGPEIVALDRVLELDGVHLSPGEAEQVFKDVQTAHSPPSSVYSRVLFTPESLISAPGGRGSILLAHLDGAELLSPSGRVIVRYPANAFPSAAERADALAQKTAVAVGGVQAAAQAEAARKLAEQKARDEAAKTAADRDVAAVRQAAASSQAGTPYGPEIVGLRLGMPMSQAEAVTREHMSVGSVLQADTAPGSTGRSLGRVRIFLSQDRGEQISLLEGAGKTVLGIRRDVAMGDSTSDAQLLELLSAKYGPPRSTVQRNWTWGSETWPCGTLRGGMLTGLAVVDGTVPPAGWNSALRSSQDGFTIDAPAPGSPSPDLARWARCEPLMKVSRNSDRLMESLYDTRVFAVEQADQQTEQARVAPPPKL